MDFLEVLFELSQQRVLEMEDALTDLADGVLVLLAGDLVMGGTRAEPDLAQGTGHGEGLESTVDG